MTKRESEFNFQQVDEAQTLVKRIIKRVQKREREIFEAQFMAKRDVLWSKCISAGLSDEAANWLLDEIGVEVWSLNPFEKLNIFE
jgi:hypothetical protein